MNPFCTLAIVSVLLLSACSKEAADGLADPGISGSLARFAIHNGYLYALNPNEVRTYSLENPDKPALTHTLTTDYGLETILVYDNTIYLGSTTSLYILNIDNPAAPRIASQTPGMEWFAGRCDPVVVKNQFVFSTVKIIENRCGFAAAQSALLVYDATDKTAPQLLATYPLGLPNGLGYKDHYLFICDEGTDKLELFDITDPRQPTLWSDFSVEMVDPVDLIVDGAKMIVSTKTDFQIYDVSALPVVKRIGTIVK